MFDSRYLFSVVAVPLRNGAACIAHDFLHPVVPGQWGCSCLPPVVVHVLVQIVDSSILNFRLGVYDRSN